MKFYSGSSFFKRHTLKDIVNSLFFLMFRNYAIVVVTFAILTGLIFLPLYSRTALSANQNILLRQAASIAKRVALFVDDDDYITYPSFLEILEELESLDVWIISNPKSPMPHKYTNIDISVKNQPEIAPLIRNVFSGKSDAMSVYSETYGDNYIFTAVPITLKNGANVGAVFVNQVAETQKNVVARSFTVIIISTLIALLISLVFAVFLARRLSLPISQMRFTALRLADGDYNTHTNIKKGGEIGDLAGAIDVLSDKLKSAEKERKDLEQMRLDFFANVSHELRTPITVIRAYSETLLDGVVSNKETIHEYYLKMLTECKSMERLVGDLLALSKMQNPDFTLEKEPINLVQVFDDMLKNGRILAQEKHIDIKFNTVKDVLLMYGDYDRIRQMFMIILDNAIKFSYENKDISIDIVLSPSSNAVRTDEYETTGNRLIISITDYGVGIPKEELPYIFDKFYKSKLRQNAKGSGLGLAIARQIAFKHGGNISVENDGKTTFKFEFDEISPI